MSEELKVAVLLTAPYIPAGMTGIHWNGVESAGIGPESTGIAAFLQEQNWNPQEWDWIPQECNILNIKPLYLII